MKNNQPNHQFCGCRSPAQALRKNCLLAEFNYTGLDMSITILKRRLSVIGLLLILVFLYILSVIGDMAGSPKRMFYLMYDDIQKDVIKAWSNK